MYQYQCDNLQYSPETENDPNQCSLLKAEENSAEASQPKQPAKAQPSCVSKTAIIWRLNGVSNERESVAYCIRKLLYFNESLAKKIEETAIEESNMWK